MSQLNHSVGFNSVQAEALDALEDAITVDSLSCIGHELRHQRRRRVWACYQRIVELHLEDALTPNERGAALVAGAWLGELES